VSPIDDPNNYQFANFLFPTGFRLSRFTASTALCSYRSAAVLHQEVEDRPSAQDLREAVYFAYRTQPASQDAGNPPVANKYGPVADLIYINGRLTEPATLKVGTGGESS
jgi:hypothetical protein